MRKTANMSVANLLRAYREGTTRPTEVFKRIAAAAAHDDETLGAVFVSRRSEEDLLRIAKELETSERKDKPLYGIPFAVKDNIDVEGMITTNGVDKDASSSSPATSSSPTVALLEEAGAVVIGKTNMDQLATGLVGTRSPFGIVRNAFDSQYISGGSSSGSAVAVAAGLCAFSLGTDTAGSGRVPAGFNNIYGWKPTRGLLSLRGVRPACQTLDTVSVFALDVQDLRLVARSCARYDDADAFSRIVPAGPRLYESGTYRAAVPDEASLDVDEDARDLWKRTIETLHATGAEVVEVDYAPFAEAARLLYEGPWVAERFQANARMFPDDDGVVHPVVRDIVEPAKDLRTHDAFGAFYRLRELRRSIDRTLSAVDVLIHPTTPTGPMRVEDVLADPIALNSRCGYYTNHMNLADMCGLAVPVGFMSSSSLPFGATVSAPAGRDDFLLDVADRFARELRTQAGAPGRVAYVENRGCDHNEDVRSIFVEEPRTPLVVCGAHMAGLGLNTQLAEIGAHFLREVRTSETYRMIAFENMEPPRPGLVRAENDANGARIACELWEVPTRRLGELVAKIQHPLGIGHVELESGESVQGFVLADTRTVSTGRDISEYGGWRAFQANGR